MGSPKMEFQIGSRWVGEGHPAFIVAEIGYNFTTVEEALASMEAALECGVDAVKFQTFRADTLACRAIDFPPEAGGTNQYEEFKRFEISEEQHRRLFDHGRKLGLRVFSTPSYYDDVELLERMEVPLYKVGSDDLTNLPFLEYVGRKGKPVILSTGMGTLPEVIEAVEAVRSTGNNRMILLHCVSNYPVKNPRLLNLRVIPALREFLALPVGFSDHTTGFSAALGAVALGACVVERHFTLDKKLPVPDAFFSADPPEMKSLVSQIRELEQSLGDGVKRATPAEMEMRLQTRKSAVARAEIPEGTPIRGDQIIVKRPGTGVAPAQSARLIGRKAKRKIQAEEVITWDMV